MATAMSNGTSTPSGSESNPPTVTAHGEGKQLAKPAGSASKTAEGNTRKQSGNSNDANQRYHIPASFTSTELACLAPMYHVHHH